MPPNDKFEADDHTVPSDPLPPQEISRYQVDRDPHSENDISNYVNTQAPDETVLHVEKIKQETVIGDIYNIWDVTTDKDRWWVITNPTNLYSQKLFPSMDYVISFHVGLMMRVRSLSGGVDSDEPHPFDEVLRREEQAEERHDRAVEPEDYQAVGMQLRECLISLVGAMRRRVPIPKEKDAPQAANFTSWSEILLDEICGGSANQELRRYVKIAAKETWQLVNWLTHDRNADRVASSVAIRACTNIVGHFGELLQRWRTGETDVCPVCKSRQIRTHYDNEIAPDGDYYASCGVCEWDSHPGHQS